MFISHLSLFYFFSFPGGYFLFFVLVFFGSGSEQFCVRIMVGGFRGGIDGKNGAVFGFWEWHVLVVRGSKNRRFKVRW